MRKSRDGSLVVIAFFDGILVGIQPLGWYVSRENNAEFDTKVNRSENSNMAFQNGPGVSSHVYQAGCFSSLIKSIITTQLHCNQYQRLSHPSTIAHSQFHTQTPLRQ
jgi:hypothetical protein